MKKAKIGKKNGTKGRPTLKDVRYRNSGRPTVMTPEAVQKLQDALEMGYNITEACFSAGISTRSFYDHSQKNEDFRLKVEVWKTDLKRRSKKLISLAVDKGDVGTAKWVLEKTDPSFTNKIEHAGEIKSKVVYIEKEEKQSYEDHIDKVINQETDGD